ncbi:hypothetical protein VZT92_004767 [Zoarces viviparus]|uniref:Uncharacterized protein n=1 Tax=Zoarces viviparus TaxID=48416 RepID=A0AAW1FU45_ZOAVI
MGFYISKDVYSPTLSFIEFLRLVALRAIPKRCKIRVWEPLNMSNGVPMARSVACNAASARDCFRLPSVHRELFLSWQKADSFIQSDDTSVSLKSSKIFDKKCTIAGQNV